MTDEGGQMNKQREALEKALLALEIAPLDHNSVKSSFFEKRHYAIIALRETLAEPEPEPVAVVTSQTGDPVTMSWHHEPALPIGTKLYAAPPARKSLSSEELQSIPEYQKLLRELGPVWAPMLRYFCEAIERAHGIGEP